MIELKARQLAEEKGITNPLTLSQVSGLAYATCHKMWNDQPRAIGFDTIDRLCDALDCGPGDLLVKTPSKGKAKRG